MRKILTLATVLCVSALPALADNKDGMDMDAKADHFFNDMDADKNGMVSKSEHDAFTQKKFAECDTNKDGMISRDEMRAHKKMEHDKRRSEAPEKKDKPE